MAMRVTVDPAQCQGHGLCLEYAPALFAMNEIEHATAVRPDVPAGQERAARAAAAGCPEGAIAVET